ncbi:MAG: lipoyl domain-containing protein [Lachnotalea sp.]
MRIAIIVPESAMPKKDPVNPCACQDKPVRLKFKTGTLTWLVELGDKVLKGDVVCEGEVEKKALEFLAPCDGSLDEICIEDDGVFKADDILGYVKEEDDYGKTN